MENFYVQMDKESCTIYKIEDTVVHDEFGVHMARLRTIIASGEIDIMSKLGFYPVKAGCLEKVAYNFMNFGQRLDGDYMWAFEVKRVDFKFDVKYHADGIWYEFNPALEIASEKDEAELREAFERSGYTFDVYIGTDGKKHAKITKG